MISFFNTKKVLKETIKRNESSAYVFLSIAKEKKLQQRKKQRYFAGINKLT